MNDRLSVVDDIFLRTHRGFGLPIALQGIWSSHEHVDRVDLAAVHANLAYGRLGRRVVAPSVLGARRRWTVDTDTLPFAFRKDALADDDILDWADGQADVDLDPQFGPGWRLSAASTTSGGTVISLVCSHALADAAGLIAAAGEAFEGSAPRQHRSRRTSDLVDAVMLVARVTAGSTRAFARLAISRRSRRAVAAFVRTGEPRVHRCRVSTAVFDVAAQLSNAEFISLVTEIAAELGEPMPVTVGVPFRSAVRGANAIDMATIEVSATDSPSDIKSACKIAFADPAGAPAGFPAEAVQLLSDSAAASVTASRGSARVLCSNIGVLPASILNLGGHRTFTLATRALHPRAEGNAATTALSGYISTAGTMSTLSLVGTEERFAERLTECAAAVLARRGLPATSWRPHVPRERTTVNP